MVTLWLIMDSYGPMIWSNPKSVPLKGPISIWTPRDSWLFSTSTPKTFRAMSLALGATGWIPGTSPQKNLAISGISLDLTKENAGLMGFSSET